MTLNSNASGVEVGSVHPYKVLQEQDHKTHKGSNRERLNDEKEKNG